MLGAFSMYMINPLLMMMMMMRRRRLTLTSILLVILPFIIFLFPMNLALEVQVDYFLNGFSVKTIVLVGIYNQQFKGTDFFLWSLTFRARILRKKNKKPPKVSSSQLGVPDIRQQTDERPLGQVEVMDRTFRTGRWEKSCLRELQHTPVEHTPDIPFHPQMKGIPKHKLLVGGLGYAPGVCCKVLRSWGRSENIYGKTRPSNKQARVYPYCTYVYYHGICCVTYRFLGVVTHKCPL